MTKKNTTIVLIIIMISSFLGCGDQNMKNTDNNKDLVIDNRESTNGQDTVSLEQTETDQVESEKEEKVEEIYKGNLEIPIDYEFLEDKYGIYKENICTDPHSIYESQAILDLELVKDGLEYEKEMKAKIPEIELSEHDYFVFDFNGDGLDDYLVCFHGTIWSGSGGNAIYMYVQEEEGLVERLIVTAKIFRAYPHDHEAIAVLNQRVDGYYSLVLPWTKNRVWSYDSEAGGYDSYRYADEEQFN